MGWLWLTLSLTATAQTPAGVTVAGGNGEGSGPSQLYNPYSAAVDGEGYVYVADYNNHRIQKFPPNSTSATAGTTVAGGNGKGSAPNQLDSPTGVAVDGEGNIYVADFGNNRIQMWEPKAISGITVAGGSGGSTSSQLDSPTGVAVDGEGNIYVTDTFNDRIQMWEPKATSGKTVVGGNGRGSAPNQLYLPAEIAIDRQGNLYVADFGNSRIQMWEPKEDKVTTVAGGNGVGSAPSQLAFPTGVAVDGQGNLYVADRNNYRIQLWTPGASSGITVAGGNGRGSAPNQLDSPSGVAVDEEGNIYVADYSNNRIQKFVPQPTLTKLSAVPNPVCTGQSLSFTATVGNLTSSYSYTLSNGIGTPLTGTADSPTFSQSLTATGTGPQSYTLTLTTPTGTATANVGLTINALPTQYAVTGGGPYCQTSSGAVVGLAGSEEGVSYQLRLNDTNVGTALAGTGTALDFGPQRDAGIYSVLATRVTGACQQPMSGSVSVSITSLPTPTLTNDGPITCNNPRAVLSAGGGESYVFSGATTTNGSSATVSSGGTYTVTVTANGCSSFTTTTVESNTVSPENVTLNSSGTLTCAQTSVNLIASSTTEATYNVAGPGGFSASGSTVHVNQPGTYTLTVAGTNGCTATTTTTVESNTTAPQNVTLTNNGPLTCAKTSVQLNASSTTTGVLSYSFAGTNPITQDGTAVATVTNGGTYTATVTGTNGCATTATTEVSISLAGPTVSLTNTGPLSFTNNSVTLTATEGAGYSYSFSQGAVQQSGNNKAQVATAGVYSVTVTRQDNGCSTTASTTVLGGSSPTACRGESTVISVAVAGDPIRYEWYKNTLTSPKLMETPQLFRGTATSSLTLINAQTNTQGNFFLKVTDRSGSVRVYGPYRLTVDGNCRAREAAQLETPLQVELAPNPIQQERLRAVVRGAEGRPLQVELVDLSGKPIRQQRWQQADSQHLIDWDMQAQSSGMYLLQVVSEAGILLPAQRQRLKIIKP
ncbi:hypothetical protein GCM10027341_11010 [Spirosoma knui]